MQASLERLRRRREELGDEGGFTLIELLIVIVILGILAAIVVFAVQNLTSSSATASCRTDFKSVESAMETYKAQMGSYPLGGGVQVAGGTVVSTSTATDTDNKTAPAFQAGANASPAVGPTGVNAAGALSPATATLAVSANTYGGELLRGSNTAASGTTTADNQTPGALTSNLDSPSGIAATATGAVGPWLKDVPQNTGHYTVWAANDGTGQIAVLNAKSIAVQGTDHSGANDGWFNDITACNSI